MVDKINWCRKQKKDMKMIEPNENLSKEYMRTAEESLEVLKAVGNKSKVWLATTKYYTKYFVAYSLMMRIGIKSEIHDCTIEICKLLEENKYLPNGFSVKLEEDKRLRIDNQYYLKNKEVPIDYENLLDTVLKVKDLNLKMDVKDIKKIRSLIEVEK